MNHRPILLILCAVDLAAANGPSSPADCGVAAPVAESALDRLGDWFLQGDCCAP